MAGRRLDPADIPTPGPWRVRGAAEAAVSGETAGLEIKAATRAGPSGGHALIRQARSADEAGNSPNIAGGIRRPADARLLAAAPDLADALLRLLISPALNARDVDPNTREARDAAWSLLIQVAPHLEIGARR